VRQAVGADHELTAVTLSCESSVVNAVPSWPRATTRSETPLTFIHTLVECGTPTPWAVACWCTFGRPGVKLMVFHTFTGTATTAARPVYTFPDRVVTRT
jgi:hypothetical protein